MSFSTVLVSTGSLRPDPTGIEVDAGRQTTQAVDRMLEGLVNALPRIGAGLLIFLVFYLIARLVRGPVERKLAAKRSKSFGRVFSSITASSITIIGFLLAMVTAAPSVEVGTLLGGLGLLGVAAGFAFQDILSNLLSGILLLLRDPFRSGDQIAVNGVQGTVQLITIRETQIRTFDGRLVYVPNADVYQNAIEVQTSQPYVRTSVIVGVDYAADLAVARATALEVLAGIDGIRDEPAPQAYYTEFAASSINLDLRYWTGSQQAEIRRVQDQVVEHIKAAYDEAGISIPFGIVTLDANENFERAMTHALQGAERS